MAIPASESENAMNEDQPVLVIGGTRGTGLLIAYTIIRTGILMNRASGQRVIEVTQLPLPLSPRYRIARADVAEVFLAARLESTKL
jgi:hypothetical protein